MQADSTLKENAAQLNAAAAVIYKHEIQKPYTHVWHTFCRLVKHPSIIALLSHCVMGSTMTARDSMTVISLHGLEG